MLSKTDIQIHQNSFHAVVVINIKNVDSKSVVKCIPKEQDCVLVKFWVKDLTEQSKQKQVALKIQPLLNSGIGSEEGGVKVEDCSISVSKENVVFRIAKLDRTEWQEIGIHFYRAESTDWSCLESSAKLYKDNNSIMLEFVTEKNVSRVYKTIQEETIWKIDKDLRVGNTEAKRVPGINAIQLTAELKSS